MTTNHELYERACRVIPSGVNSPVRAFNAVGGDPIFAASGSGAHVTSEEGKRYLDFCGSWGPLVLGHAHPAIQEAIARTLQDGTTFGMGTRREVELAELVCQQIPYVEMVRLVNSGTEAVMTALRLARGATGRTRIIKFEGCYHGHVNDMLVSAGSGLLTSGQTTSAGIPESVTREITVLPYNDGAAAEEAIIALGDDLAAVIVEPVAGNMGLVPPADGFLEQLRRLTEQVGAKLIFDEVITGFRLAPTTYGAQIGIEPDITCLGKIIGGGLPVGAIAARRELMQLLAPAGPVYQAGTLSGNPLAVAAGMAALTVLRDAPPYAHMATLGNKLASGINALATEARLPMHVAQLGGMFTPFFRAESVHSLTDAKACDTAAFATFHRALRDAGIYLPPSQFETAFVSAAHTDEHIQLAIDAMRHALGL
jgi:glutamate-1-semialdehyde 2,1-aminomutase